MTIIEALFKKPDLTSPSSTRRHCIAHSVVSAMPGLLFLAHNGWGSLGGVVWYLLGIVVGVVLLAICIERVHRLNFVRTLLTGTFLGEAWHSIKLLRLVVCFFAIFLYVFLIVEVSLSGSPQLSRILATGFIIIFFWGVPVFLPDFFAVWAGSYLTGSVVVPKLGFLFDSETAALWIPEGLGNFLLAAFATLFMGTVVVTGLLLLTGVFFVACMFLWYTRIALNLWRRHLHRG